MVAASVTSASVLRVPTAATVVTVVTVDPALSAAQREDAAGELLLYADADAELR